MSERLSNAIDMVKKPIALVATAAAFGGGYAAINKGGEGNPLNSPDAGAAALVGAENCDAMDGFKDLAAGFNEYAFGPEADEGIKSGDDSDEYVAANPFADGKDMGKVSLAAFMSLATIPATKDATTLSTEYIKNFDSTLKAYNTQEDAVEDAKEDCATTMELLDKSANYTDNFAGDGEPIVRVSRVIEGGRTTMKFKKMGSLTLEGVEISRSDDKSERTDSETGREYNGFPSLLITKEGVIYLKGVTVEPKPKAGEQPDKKKAKSGSKGDNNNSTGQSQSSNGGGGSGTQEGQGGTGGGSDGCGPSGCGEGSTGDQINGNNGNTNNGNTNGSGSGENAGGCGGCGGGGGGGGNSTGTSCGGCGGGGTTTSTPTPGPNTSTPTGGGNETPPPASPPPTGGGGDTPTPATEPAKGEETGVPTEEACPDCD